MTTTETPTIDALAARLAILEDERAVRSLVTRMGTLIDRGDWAACEELFHDPVYADWSAVSGVPAAKVDPADLVGGWRASLSGLETTQHLTAGHDIHISGDHATCTCYVIGTHRLANGTGGSLWIVGGRYDHELARDTDGWRITSAALTPFWASGNQHILTLGAVDASSGVAS